MATERDAYELDTSQATAQLALLKTELGKVTASQLELIASLKDLGESQKAQAEETAKATAKWAEIVDAAKAAANAVKDYAIEAVKLILEQAAADRLLEHAAGASSEALLRQAEAIEKSIGIDAVKVEHMQRLLVAFGEAPSKIDATVRAILDYSAFTGVDAVGATEQLTSAINSGKPAFRELGIEYESTGKKSKDLENATAALMGRVGGTAASDRDTLAGQTRLAAAAWEDLQKSFGRVIVDFATKTDVIRDLTEAVRGFQIFAFGDPDDPKRQAYDAMMNKEIAQAEVVKALREQAAHATEMPANLVAGNVLATNKALTEAIAKLHELQAARRAFIAEPGLADKNANDGLTHKAVQDAETARDKAKAEHEKSVEMIIESAREWSAEQTKIAKQNEANLYTLALAGSKVLAKADEDEVKLFEQQGEAAAAADEKRRTQMEEQNRAWHLKEFEEAKRQNEKLLDLKIAYERELVGFANASAESLLSAQVGYLWQNVTANTQAAGKLRELEEEKAVAGLTELEALQKKAAMETQLQEEQVAGFWKVTAETLSSIGQQALMKGLMAGADALAFLAVGNIPAATLAGEAALAYGAVAIGAGGAAAGISAARGVSADEQAQIDAASKSSTPTTSSASASTSKGGAAGTGGGAQVVQNVTYFGISSTSEIHQAAELERLRRKLVAQKTGAGGGP